MTNIAKIPPVDTTVGYVAGEIRAQSARRGLSGRQLAFQLGKSQPWVSRRLTGEIPFDVAELDSIASILGVAVRDLFPADEDGPRHGGGIALSESEQRVIFALRASETSSDSDGSMFTRGSAPAAGIRTLYLLDGNARTAGNDGETTAVHERLAPVHDFAAFRAERAEAVNA